MQRVTLTNNVDWSKKAVVLVAFDDSNFANTCFRFAKAKLRLKSPSILYDQNGQVMENQTQDSSTTVYISSGEAFNGKEGRATTKAPVKIIAENSFIDDAAVKQLEKVACMDDVQEVVGMPDLHPGGQFPIGCVVATTKTIYPKLVGNDCGCGMSVKNLGFVYKEKQLTHWHNMAQTTPRLSDIEIAQLKREAGVTIATHDDSLGTIGGGNHFEEVQRVCKIVCSDTCAQYGLVDNSALLTVHSGSRNLGQVVSDNHATCLIAGSPEADCYIHDHDQAVKWAILNRHIIGLRLTRHIFPGKNDPATILDISHNNVTYNNTLQMFLHRKGAAPSDKGLIVIPGSRGDHSYLVKPKDNLSKLLFSLAHGSGRKMSRADAYKKTQKRHGKNLEHLTHTEYGSRVICTDDRTLCEEVPDAYKPVDAVIEDLAEYITVVAVLAPCLTIKSLP